MNRAKRSRHGTRVLIRPVDISRGTLFAAPVAADTVTPVATALPEGGVSLADDRTPMVAQAGPAAPSDELGNVTEEEAAVEPTEAGRILTPWSA